MWFLFYVAVIVLFLLDLYGRESFPAPCLFSFLFCTFLLSLSVIPIAPLLELSYQQLWIFLHLIFIPSIQQLLPLKPPCPLSSLYIVVTFVHYPGCWQPAVLLCDLTAAFPRMGPFIRPAEHREDTNTHVHKHTLNHFTLSSCSRNTSCSDIMLSLMCIFECSYRRILSTCVIIV